jgi:hypothetical protein
MTKKTFTYSTRELLSKDNSHKFIAISILNLYYIQSTIELKTLPSILKITELECRKALDMLVDLGLLKWTQVGSVRYEGAI